MSARLVGSSIAPRRASLRLGAHLRATRYLGGNERAYVTP
jgi:hypothetical protein